MWSTPHRSRSRRALRKTRPTRSRLLSRSRARRSKSSRPNAQLSQLGPVAIATGLLLYERALVRSHAMSTEARPVRRLTAPTPRVALVIGAFLIGGILLYLGRSALAPFILGALIVYLLDPAVGWLSRIRIGRRTIPRGLAVLVVYAVVVLVVVQG